MELVTRWAWVLGLIGVAALIGSASIGYVTGTFDGGATWWAIAGAVALIGYAVFDRDRVGRTMSSRAFVYGSGSWLMVVLFAVISVAIYKLAVDHDKTWDLTSDGSFTLSDHTIRVVSGLAEPIEVTAFYRKMAPDRDKFADLIGRFQEHTSALTVTYHDPLSSPRLADRHNITSDHGTVILTTADGREKRLEGDITEQEFTARLVLLVARQEHRICWSIGHGEADPDSEYSPEGLGQMVLALEEVNYQITNSLILTEGIDAACEVLVIVSPRTPWLPSEREALARYVADGGQVFLMIDPFQSEELADELERYGIAVGDDEVWDESYENRFPGIDEPSVIVLRERNFQRHPITSSLAAVVVLEIARSIAPLDGVDGVKVEILLESGFMAWAETHPNGDEVVASPEETFGEIPMMVVAEITDPSVLDVEGETGKAGGRMVVIGDSGFASNGLLNIGNNRDLFLNTIAWLVKEEDQIGERPAKGDVLDMGIFGEALMCLISIFFVPGAAVFLGGVVLFRRRWL